MSGTIFFISDLHFGHHNIYTRPFTDKLTGERFRPWDSCEEAEEAIIDAWNSVVTKKDTVYLLGDAAFKRSHLNLFKRLAANKLILIGGNHDNFRTQEYLDNGFDRVRGLGYLPKHKLVLSHAPVHPQSLAPHGSKEFNVHGHLHTAQVMLPGTMIPDTRYFNVSCERVNFTPVSLESLKERIASRILTYGEPSYYH